MRQYHARLSHAQRRLSTPVRLVRRRVLEVTGRIELVDGTALPITSETLAGDTERALQALSASVICLAIALVVLRVT